MNFQCLRKLGTFTDDSACFVSIRYWVWWLVSPAWAGKILEVVYLFVLEALLFATPNVIRLLAIL